MSDGRHESESTPSQDPLVGSCPTMLKHDRWSRFLTWTIVINSGCLVLYSGLICGCCFHPEALVVATIPFLWGFYPYFCYRTSGERVVGYISCSLSMLWLCLEWTSNLQFALSHLFAY